MIDIGTALGLQEIDSVSATVDISEVGVMNPNAQAFYGINPHSSHVRVARVVGVTTVASLPAGGILSGQAALINLSGATPREMAVLPSAALVINFPSLGSSFNVSAATTQESQNLTEAVASRDRNVEQLRNTLRDAEAYGRAHDAYARDKSLPRPARSVVLESLVPFVRGERLVIIRANREQEIRDAVRFAQEMRLRAAILGGNDAWKVVDLLREQRVPVILTGVMDLPPREDDYYDTLYENASRLQKAGVMFSISTGDTGAQVRDLPFHAGMAAAFGLPRSEALKAVTLYPAQIMNVADRLGSLEPGKVANLVVTDGDLLEARTNVKYLFIKGEQIPLTSRHTELYEEFKNRD
ncbi:MAG: amidohydrolase family protein [Pyrinomonadaceae bacterium]|nr:amidohydrolase family protein [Pyrinomonadaceae bacterium]